MTRTIELGISTCPNDTFAFHALMEPAVEWRGLEFHVELMDIDALNRGLAAGRFDAAKASFHAALRLSDDVVVLPSGSALGFGVGPVLLAAAGRTHPSQPVDGRPPKVLCPGEWTTATLLFRLFHTGVGHLEQVRFSEIMPALEEGSADFGVCIHEGRFTWRDRGLNLVEDLGTTWEGRTGAPLPLGGIMGRKESGQEDLLTIAEVIRDSIAWARKHPAETLATIVGSIARETTICAES